VRHRSWVSVLLLLAATTSACSSSSGGTTQDGKTELTIATFNEFGYEDLLPEYEAAHPDVKITQRKTGTADPHHKNLFT
jgi:cellobiose transport system substrate-binding protein